RKCREAGPEGAPAGRTIGGPKEIIREDIFRCRTEVQEKGSTGGMQKAPPSAPT
ncbi:unnamed protein product, partial [Amoebophrya sp. A25]